MNIADKQISNEIEGKTEFHVYFEDVFERPLLLSVYEQSGKFWSQTSVFGFESAATRRTQEQISWLLKQEIRAPSDQLRQYNTDPRILATHLSIDDFFKCFDAAKGETRREHSARKLKEFNARLVSLQNKNSE